MSRRLTVVVLGLALIAAPAVANDSTAAMGAGGLVLQRTDGIAMVSEDLYVSAREVRVKYRFLNHTAEPIETLVAFPMPDISGSWEESVGGDVDSDRIVPFITWVDDHAVHAQVERKAMVGDRDVTAELTALNLPLSPSGMAAMTAMEALSDADADRLAAAGLISVERGDDARWITPHWTLKTTWYWTQYFDPGREVVIEHLYAPATGGSAGSIVGDGETGVPQAATDYTDRYCTDDAFIAAAARKRAEGLYLAETWVNYILTTGANWSGPIGDFRLVVDKGSTDNLVSFCGEGVRKIGPTQFEVRHQNWTPTRDLEVLILTGHRLER
jgi:hypothetical protein